MESVTAELRGQIRIDQLWISCHLLWFFSRGRSIYENFNWPLTKNSRQQQPNFSERKNVFTPRKNLGHYKVPDSNGKTHIAKVREKAQETSKAIHRTHSTRDEFWMMYESVYRPAVEYLLAQSFIPAPQLQIIAQKTMPRIYSKYGFNRNTSGSVRS